jgi:hypothetical protein
MGAFGEQGEGTSARCAVHHDFGFSGHFLKCTKQVKKGLPCKCVAKRCAGCQLPESGQTSCSNPSVCGMSVGGAPCTFCDECRAVCANPATCGRYIHGVDCVECGDFSEAATCTNCEGRTAVVERAMMPVGEATDAALASATAAAMVALQQATNSDGAVMELFQRLTTRMRKRIVEARTPNAGHWAHEDADADEAIGHLKAGAGIPMEAVISMTAGLQRIAEEVCAVALQATQDSGLQPVSAAAARVANSVAAIENGDWEAVQLWLLDEEVFPRGFLARFLLCDLVRQLSPKKVLDFQVPKTLTGQQAKVLLAHAISNGQASKLSKDNVAQMTVVAKAAAQEAARDLETCTQAMADVNLQVFVECVQAACVHTAQFLGKFFRARGRGTFCAPREKLTR